MLILYLHLVLDAHPGSLSGTLAWAGLLRRLACSRHALEKSARELERLGFVGLDQATTAPFLHYRVLRGNRWGARL